MRHMRPPRPPSPPVVRRAGYFLRTRSVVLTGKVASLLTSQITIFYIAWLRGMNETSTRSRELGSEPRRARPTALRADPKKRRTVVPMPRSVPRREASSVSIPKLPESLGPAAEQAIARRWRRVRRRERLAVLAKAVATAGGLLFIVWGLKIVFLRMVFLVG